MLSLNELDLQLIAFLVIISVSILYKVSKTLLGCTLITCSLILSNVYFKLNAAFALLAITPILFFNVRNLKNQFNNQNQLYSDLMELLCGCVSAITLFLPKMTNSPDSDFAIHIILAFIPMIYSEIVKYIPPKKPTAYELWLEEKAERAAEIYFERYGYIRRYY
jgi:hypothetical protein